MNFKMDPLRKAQITFLIMLGPMLIMSLLADSWRDTFSTIYDGGYHYYDMKVYNQWTLFINLINGGILCILISIPGIEYLRGKIIHKMGDKEETV